MTAIPFPGLRRRPRRCPGRPQRQRHAARAGLAAGGAVARTHADLDLRFYNACISPDILAEITLNPARAGQIFRVRGGTRITAGPATGQVKVTTVAGDRCHAPGAARRAGRRLLDLHDRAGLGCQPHRSVLQHDRIQVPPRLLHQRLRAGAAGPAAGAGPCDRLSRQGLRLVPPRADDGDGGTRARLAEHERGRPRPGADRPVRGRGRRTVGLSRTAS